MDLLYHGIKKQSSYLKNIALGTILGWILSNLSRSGKLNIYPTWNDNLRYIKAKRFDGKARQADNDYLYSLELDLYNSSGDSKIMRKIEVVFFQDEEELFRDIPDDNSTGRDIGPLRLYDKVCPITVPSKTVYSIKMRGCICDKDDRYLKLWKTNRIILLYRDCRDKEKELLLQRKAFSDYISNSTVDIRET